MVEELGHAIVGFAGRSVVIMRFIFFNVWCWVDFDSGEGSRLIGVMLSSVGYPKLAVHF